MVATGKGTHPCGARAPGAQACSLAIPGGCARFASLPAAGRRGLSALVPFACATRKGRSLRSLPASRVPPHCARLRFGLFALAPRGSGSGGAGLGGPSLPCGAVPPPLPPLLRRAGGSGFWFGFSWGCAVASSSPLVVSRGGRVLAALPWRRLVGSALSAGCSRWRLRASSRSFSGAVLVVGFACFGRAASFASAWSGWVGFPVAVSPRAGAAGRLWCVSVPVAAPVAAPVRPAVSSPAGSAPCWFFRSV